MSYDRDTERQKMRADRRDHDEPFDFVGFTFLIGYFVSGVLGATIGIFLL